MKKTTYIIPRCDEFMFAEINYVKNMNKAFDEIVKIPKSFTKQTVMNTLKTLFEQSKWKQWYIVLNNKIYIQEADYWKDKRMQESWFLHYISKAVKTKEEQIQLADLFEKIYNEFIEKIKKIEWVEIIEED